MEKSQNTKIALLLVTLLIIMITSVLTTVIMYQLLMEIKDTNEKSIKIYNRLNEEIEYDIEGLYNLYNPNSEAVSYKFDNGKVKYEALSWMEGTYEIIENKIKITYEKAYDPDGIEMTDFDKEEEMTIITNDTLMSKREVDGKTQYSKYTREY